MGILTYGFGTEHEIEDRPLCHLEAVVRSKLARQESFFVSWTITRTDGSGRISIWVAPSIPMQFRLFGSRPPQLDRTWIELMMRMAHSPHGVTLLTESDVRAIKRGDRTLAEVASAISP